MYFVVFLLEDSDFYITGEGPVRPRWPLFGVLLICLFAFAVSWTAASPRETRDYNDLLRYCSKIFIGAVLLQCFSLHVEDPELALLGSTVLLGGYTTLLVAAIVLKTLLESRLGQRSWFTALFFLACIVGTPFLIWKIAGTTLMPWWQLPN